MRSIRLLVPDLDGTLIHPDGAVSDYTAEVLRRCRDAGLPTAIATARFWAGAAQCIRQLSPDYEITTDGALLHRGGELLWQASLPPETADRIIAMVLERAADGELRAASGKTVFWNGLDTPGSVRHYDAVPYDFRQPLGLPVNKLVAVLPDRTLAEEIAAAADVRLIGYRGERLYGFLPREAGKLRAVRELARILGIGLSEIAAFGDDENDLELLTACGIGVAVADAPENVRRRADAVCGSCADDGPARWIEKHLL